MKVSAKGCVNIYDSAYNKSVCDATNDRSKEMQNKLVQRMHVKLGICKVSGQICTTTGITTGILEVKVSAKGCVYIYNSGLGRKAK